MHSVTMTARQGKLIKALLFMPDDRVVLNGDGDNELFEFSSSGSGSQQ